MMSQRDIQVKDFSISMGCLVNKLHAICSALICSEGQDHNYHEKDLVGFGLILQDIGDDLSQIYSALYDDEDVNV